MLLFFFTHTPLKFFVSSFWRDEAFSYLLAKKNVFSILLLTAKDFNPPLYYILLHFWIKIFGSSEIAIRLLSLIFYWATIYVCFLFLNNIFKFTFKKSLIFMFIFVTNPILVYYAFEARMYTMFAFFTTLSFYLFYKKDSKGYFWSTILSLYTNYFSIFIVILHTLFIYITHQSKNDRIKWFKHIIITALVFLPWIILVFLVKNKNDFLSFWLIKLGWNDLLWLPAIIYTGYERDLVNYHYSKSLINFTLLLLSLFFVFILILGFIKTRKINIKLFLYLFIYALGIPFVLAIISFFYPIFLPRYLIFSTVGFLILLVYLIDHFRTGFKISVFITIIIVAMVCQYLQIKYREKADLRKTIREIKKMAKKDDYIYVTNELDFHVAQYYYNENKILIYGKTYEEIPKYVGKVLIPKEKITNTLPLYPRKAFIIKQDGSYDIQALY